MIRYDRIRFPKYLIRYDTISPNKEPADTIRYDTVDSEIRDTPIRYDTTKRDLIWSLLP